LPRIMADNDSRGQVAVLLRLLRSEVWGEFWKKLDCPDVDFAKLGLPPTAPDSAVWLACQEQEIILITSNRNHEGPDSLEATIRQYNRADSLPVITISDSRRLMRSKAYAEKAVERLLEYLLDLDNQRGTGRLYIP
jgi:hypothetical protein